MNVAECVKLLLDCGRETGQWRGRRPVDRRGGASHSFYGPGGGGASSSEDFGEYISLIGKERPTKRIKGIHYMRKQ